MKKFWLFIVSILLVVPFSVRADYVKGYTRSSGAVLENGYPISKYYYSLTNGDYNGQTLFCTDAGLPNPHIINSYSSIDTNSSFGKGIVAIFSAGDVLEASDVTINDALRIYTALYDGKTNSGFTVSSSASVSSAGMIYMLNNAAYTLAGIGTKPCYGWSTISSPTNTLKKVFCAGVKANGSRESKTYYYETSNGTDHYYIDTGKVIDGCSNNVAGVPNITNFNQAGDVKVNISEVSRKPASSDKVFSQEITAKVTINPTDAKIKITGCSVNNSNYECSIGDSLNKEIAHNGTFKILVQTKNNNIITDATQVNVTVSYSFNNGKSYNIKWAKCNSSEISGSNGCGWRRYGYQIDGDTQRMILINKKTDGGTGDVTFGVNVPKSCTHDAGGYKIGNKTVSVKDYMNYGCCSDIDINDLTDPNDLAIYKDTCMDDDIVSFSNVCGSSLGCLERDGDYKNNKYVGYSKSAIFQKSLKNVMNKVNVLENGAYKTGDLANMYNEKQISNNLDKNYTSKLSPNNKYCMLYTSEDLKINFPGTTETVSGKSFVFEELTNTECKTNPNASSKNCFRQPYVNGTLSMAFHTNVDRWLNDYKAAVNAVTEANKKLQSASTTKDKEAAQANVDIAKQNVSTLENYKKECETYSNLKDNNWDYNLEPDLTFYYDQKVYAKDESSPTITTTVKMVPSYKAVKYWPNVTGNTELSGSCSGGTATYNGFTYSTNKDCNYTAKRTVYYRPEKITYSLISTGELKTIEYEHEENINENGILIGYVYNTSISIEQGEYQTRFEINNVGHNKAQSNIQNSYNKYKEEHKDASGHLYSKCIYCNKSSKTIRLCDTCPPSDAAIIYRSIATDNVTPQDRTNTNWSDVKGKVAEALIEASDGSKIISNVGENYLALADNLAVNNANNDTSDDKTIALNGSDLADLYNDSTKEYLEYEITLTTKDMQIIKKNNSKSSFSYASFNLCTNGKKVGKDENTDYCFVCNSSGKECESSFVDSFSDDSALLANTRANKWKYFYYDATDQTNPGKFISGSMKDYQSNDVFKKLFPDGKYPDPELVDAYLYVNKNWP